MGRSMFWPLAGYFLALRGRFAEPASGCTVLQHGQKGLLPLQRPPCLLGAATWPRGEPSPLGCRMSAVPAQRRLPNGADFTAVDHSGDAMAYGDVIVTVTLFGEVEISLVKDDSKCCTCKGGPLGASATCGLRTCAGVSSGAPAPWRWRWPDWNQT